MKIKAAPIYYVILSPQAKNHLTRKMILHFVQDDSLKC